MFSDGQTSSGKTFTLSGIDLAEGVIPYALHDIFERRSELLAIGTKAEVEVSYVEIYREECFDLLACRDGCLTSRSKLELRETPQGETILDGIHSELVTDITQAIRCLAEAAKGRSTGNTAMNAQSSRSHAIFTASLRVTRGTGVVVSKLHLVDLAGSERAKKTLATGRYTQRSLALVHMIDQ